jgi:hypothetical protein
MKISILLVLLLNFLFLHTYADNVDKEEAKQIAQTFMAQKTGKSELNYQLKAISDNSAWYFFSSSSSWVIVSGNTDLYPVLAFSTSHGLEANTIPPAMLSYLNARENQLQLIKEKSITHPENRAAWKAFKKGDFYKTKTNIDPLLETRWNQNWPYNMYCPTHPQGPGGHVYAGCVATAMSQIMKFHNYPESGRFSHTYFWGDQMEVDFSETTYDWESMSEVATSTSREAIAELMFHCGVSVDMNYSHEGSGSNIELAAYSMKQYFRYKSGLEFVDEYNFSDADWKFLLKEDLDKQHPILYRGTDDGGNGHAFVCDAYQDTSYFHFNWGWSGYGDGFFHLDDQDFHWGQGAVINIMPYWGEYCNSMVYTQESWSFDDGSGPNHYWNDSDCEWLIMPDNAEQIILNFETFKTSANDELFVYDGTTSDANLIGRFSGENIPASITSSGNALLLRFISDSETQAEGWSVNYESVVSDIQSKKLADISIYPNPADNYIQIELPSAQITNISVFDLSGKLVYESTISNSSRIPLEHLSKGYFIIKIKQNDGLKHIPLIIE